MKKWISIPKIEGNASRQAHADFPTGTYERELGKEGFFGPSTHMHHKHPPTSWTHWEGPLRPRAFDLTKLAKQENSPWNAATVLHNAHVKLRYWSIGQSMDCLVRNADGDDLLFIHQGSGDIFCDYGHLAVSEGDYIMIPRGTMWRLAV